MPTFEIRRREERERVWFIDAENAQDALDWTETVEPSDEGVRLIEEQIHEVNATRFVMRDGVEYRIDPDGHETALTVTERQLAIGAETMGSSVMRDTNREAFEAWAKDNGFDLSRVARAGDVLALGEYDALSTREALAVWQAATAHAQARTCQWTTDQDSQDSFYRRTACHRRLFQQIPTEYCPACGGKIEVVNE
jgi:hypothetical protein